MQQNDFQSNTYDGLAKDFLSLPLARLRDPIFRRLESGIA